MAAGWRTLLPVGRGLFGRLGTAPAPPPPPPPPPVVSSEPIVAELSITPLVTGTLSILSLMTGELSITSLVSAALPTMTLPVSAFSIVPTGPGGSPSATPTLLVGCAMNVNLFGVQDANTGNAILNGTCTFSISGVGINGSMPLLPNTPGNYQGIIPGYQAAQLTAGQTYQVNVSFNAPSLNGSPVYQDLRSVTAIAQFRT